MILLISAIVGALTVSFMCSAMEACLLSLSMADVASVTEKNHFAGHVWKGFKERLHRPISVILIVNTLANTIGATVSGAQFSQLFGAKWVWVYSLVFSFIIIQWAEILPKTLGVRYNRFVALMMARPMVLAMKLMYPLVSLVSFLNRPFEGKSGHSKSSDALREISLLARFAQINNQITTEQQDILNRSISLSTCTIKDIMVERKDMKMLSTGMNMIDALVETHIHHHTRYPLAKDGNMDDIVGFVNVKDIVSALQMNPKDPSLKGICRPVLFIQATENVTALLKNLTRSYNHMAVVKEGDKVVGIVTVEDLVEAIVGDIQDEYDILPTYAYPLNEARFLAGGGVVLKELEEKIGIKFSEPSLTLNDWLFKICPQSPKVETQLTHQGMKFIIRKMRRSKVYEVIIDKPEEFAKPAPKA